MSKNVRIYPLLLLGLLLAYAGLAWAGNVRPPKSLAVSGVTSSSISLSWVDVAPTYDAVWIDRAPAGTGPWATVITASGTATSATNTGLASGVRYYYRARGLIGSRFSSYSNTTSGVTTATAPAAPSGLAAVAASQTQINLTWTDNANNETGDYIERSIDGVAFSQIASTTVNVTGYSDSGLSASTLYYYRVRAFNGTGTSAYSAPASATTASPLPPAAPTNLVVSAASSSELDLSWTDNSTDETGFTIQKSADGVSFASAATTAANVASCKVIGLTANTLYYFQVSAFSAAGSSAFSNIASATTLNTVVTPPQAPTSLAVVSVTNTAIGLTWADNSSDETGFKVERSTDNVAFSQVATPGVNATSYSDSPLTAATLYYYRVRATNTGGDSAYTNTASATTLPDTPTAPSSLIATAVSPTEIDLAWTDNSSNETGFKVELSPDNVVFSPLATLAANTVTYVSQGLTPATQYWYRVQATNTGGDSAYTTAATATTAVASSPLAGYYVATNGTSGAAGTINAPWDLATAVAGGPGGNTVVPGDTIWVRGGTYPGHFGVHMNGTSMSPIKIRAYPGERVILDQNGLSSTVISFLESGCSYVWLWGVELTDSLDSGRTTTVAGSFPGLQRQTDLTSCYAPGCKYINCVCHDGGTAIGIWEGAAGAGIYGCLEYNNGWVGPDRGHGHGIYSQNHHPNSRDIEECISLNNFGSGYHSYGENGQAVENHHFTGCVGFNNGSWVAAYENTLYRQRNFVLGTIAPPVAQGITLDSCYFYHPYAGGIQARNCWLGNTQTGNLDAVMQHCRVMGGSLPLEVNYWATLIFSDNTVYARPTATGPDTRLLTDLVTTNGLPPSSGYTWDGNRYFDTTPLYSGSHRPFRVNGVVLNSLTHLTFGEWKSSTGFDASSADTLAAPSVNEIFLRPNSYEAGRANLTVYNWQLLPAVLVDLTTSGLADNQTFKILNTQNYYGTPVLTGTYHVGSPIVSLPMTDTTVTPPIGWGTNPVTPSTLPEFGAFVVLPTS